MTNILQINSSIYGEAGQSTQLASHFVAALREREPAARVVVRDLARESIPHLDAARFQAFLTPAGDRTAAQAAVVEFSDALIDELRSADVIVLAAPMYNFGLPTQLKAYFDHVARAGVTFRYTEQGSVGLLTGKRAYVIATRGGVHAGTARDSETQHLRDFLALLGIADVEFAYAEGLSMGASRRAAGLAAAHDALAHRLPPTRLAA